MSCACSSPGPGAAEAQLLPVGASQQAVGQSLCSGTTWPLCRAADRLMVSHSCCPSSLSSSPALTSVRKPPCPLGRGRGHSFDCYFFFLSRHSLFSVTEFFKHHFHTLLKSGREGIYMCKPEKSPQREPSSCHF